MKETTDIGQFEFTGNETKLDSTIDDAPKYRGGRQGGGALCVLSGDLLVPDPTPTEPKRMRRLEKVFVKLATDDSGRGIASGGELEIFITAPDGDGDAGQKRILSINSKQIVCHVPLVTLAGIQTSEIPWPWQDPTHGIPHGAFAELARIYEFESEDFTPFVAGRLTWPQVVERMDIRDQWRKFPKTPVPPPVQPPPPVSTEPTETHGIPAGDFAALERIYGFPSNDMEYYISGHMTWPRVIEHMDERSDYKIFPRNNDREQDGA